MLERIIRLSIRQRYAVLALALILAGLGVWAFGRLKIDAVPDITNNQVQINTVAPALSPLEVEKQVTFPVETALAGIKGLRSTRSLSRNGFSQVTAVFNEKLDIYFARQQVAERRGAERRLLRGLLLRGDLGPLVGAVELPDAEGDETRGGQREKPQQQHRAERLARSAPLGRRLRRVGGVQGAALMAASTWPGIMLVLRLYMFLDQFSMVE